MYRVKSIMGDTAFQVIKEPNVIIRTFYTESVAKEFCDRLAAKEYFERFVYPIAYDEPFNEAIKNKAYNQALEDFESKIKECCSVVGSCDFEDMAKIKEQLIK